MGKLIFLVVVIVVAWVVLKNYRNPVARNKQPREAAPEDMVRCAHCGLHLPRSESHASNEKFFCSEEHLRLHR